MDDHGCRHGRSGARAPPQRVGRESTAPSDRQVDANPTRSELAVHRQLELDPGPPRPTLNEPLLTPHEAAALLAVRVSWIYDAVRGDRLPASASAGTYGSCAPTSSAGSPTSAVRALAAATPLRPRPASRRDPRTPAARTRRRASGRGRSGRRSRSCWRRRDPA